MDLTGHPMLDAAGWRGTMREDGIANLDALGLSAAALEERRGYIGGSDAKIIGRGDKSEIRKLWQVKQGLKVPDDLRGELRVLIGLWLEPLVLALAEQQLTREYGREIRISRRGELVRHRRRRHLACNLDGWIDDLDGSGPRVVQVKCFDDSMSLDAAIRSVDDQATHEAFVTGAPATLVIFVFGKKNPIYRDLPLDHARLDELLAAEESFWSDVQAKRDPNPKPVKAPRTAAPVPKLTGEKDMSGHNEWADHAFTWLAAQEQVAKGAEAERALKELASGHNVKTVRGHGVEITIASNGAKSLRASAAPEAAK